MSNVPAPIASEVIELDSDTWKFEHDFAYVLDKKLRFANSKCVFHVRGQVHGINGTYFVVLTASAEVDMLVSPPFYTIEYESRHISTGHRAGGKMTESVVASLPLYCAGCHWKLSLELKLSDVGIASIGESFFPLKADLKSYVEQGPTVTLVGINGNVTVPRRILKLRSRALEAMFSHDSKEKETGEIELKDFDYKILSAFAHFLMTGEITDGKDTALGLLLLGDKYDIQAMRVTAENFVKKNIEQMNEEDVIDIFSKVGRKSLYVPWLIPGPSGVTVKSCFLTNNHNVSMSK